jgi:hypothetical protein
LGRRVCTSLLEIYLNDHLAGALGVRELARRAAGANGDSEYGTFLARLSGEIEADRQSLLEVMRTLGIGIDRLKLLGGWGAEKLGRLKLNGRLLGYSPLSRVVELEVLSLGIAGKLTLWHTLEHLEQPALAEFDFQHLIARGEEQLRELERHRLRASEEAFGAAT